MEAWAPCARKDRRRGARNQKVRNPESGAAPALCSEAVNAGLLQGRRFKRQREGSHRSSPCWVGGTGEELHSSCPLGSGAGPPGAAASTGAELSSHGRHCHPGPRQEKSLRCRAVPLPRKQERASVAEMSLPKRGHRDHGARAASHVRGVSAMLHDGPMTL